MKLKLGPHSLIETGDTAAWAALRPSVVKLCYDFGPARYCPAGVLVLGRPDEHYIGAAHPLGEGDPRALGVDFANSVYAPLIAAHPRIDVWEGPNEINPASPAEMEWYAWFLASFARRIKELGKRAAIGSFATGTPEMDLWRHYVPALRACTVYGAFHARHSYGPLDIWHSYRHRQDQAIFRNLGYSPEVIITECGEDAPNPPWRVKYGGDIGRYWREWIKPFLTEIQLDPYVIGATLFTVGTGFADAWKPFDVSGTGLTGILRIEYKQEDGPVYISTVVTHANGEEADQAFREFHRWIAEHDGSPRGFCWPPTSGKSWRVKATVANVRTGPGIGHPAVRQLAQGAVVVELAQSNGWVQIGAAEWMSLTVLEAI